MFLGCIKFEIFIPHSRSLKEKRQVVESIKQKLCNNFNVSVAIKPSCKWQHCELSLAVINYDKNFINKIFDRLEKFVRFNNAVQILNVEKEII
ncbi:MAG: DUF503 domain-containing protein [Candidatus Omnitrophica bacterium]|nr:DUF503 domain-containing protein [Candidatus Omnitrophota bacterium]MCM8830920.1 DUF503 domain-containing protein [Candidatus Omnitrophota bacterium]